MNKQNISKLSVFTMGLQNRFKENNTIFKEILITFTTGLKKFNGVGVFQKGKINYNFNGKTEVIDLDSLFQQIFSEALQYETISILYRERGTDLLITADNKNVKMTSKETSAEILKDTTNPQNSSSSASTTHSIAGGSTLLNRDYYIKVGKADSLLKEIGIMTKDGKIKNDKIRKYNQIDHYVELLEGILDTLPTNQTVTILDCGCGKSYLTFVLNHYLTEVKKRKCHFIGLDYSESVIASSRTMAANLGYRNMEFHALDIKDYQTDKKIHVVISLHACDTATDMALALGIRVNSDVIIAVPCCHREILSQYSYEPLNSILKHGVFKTRFADILTDGMRSLMLEAKGYAVSVVEYISPLETPKNLMIRAVKSKEEDPKAMEAYLNIMSSLNVYPSLYAFLNQWE